MTTNVIDFSDLIPYPDNDIEDLESELALPDDDGIERSVARRLALQILYEVDCADHSHNEVIASQLSLYKIRPFTTDYTIRLVKGIITNIERVDMIVQTVAQEWPLDQVAIIDRNILRIAVYEYTMIGNLPIAVVTDEAIQLAKLFGSDSAIRFVNGVLGSVFSDEARLKAMLMVDLPEDDTDEDD